MNSRFWIVLMLGVFSAPCLYAESEAHYTVSEIVKVRSAAEFDCKLSNYAYAPSARFRVQIRDVRTNADIPAEEASEYLYERLKNADQVVLQNVQFRNYFRVTADVEADGRDIKEELIRMRLALPDESAESAEAEAAATASTERRIERRYQPPVERPARAEKSRTVLRRVSIQSLMESQVDLSAINDETTLEEALQIISESVRPRVPFVILWNDLEANALIDKETPIGISEFGRVKLRQALKVIFHSLSLNAPAKVILAIEGGVVTIGTQRGLIQKATVRSYSVSDLTSVPFVEDMATQGGYSGR
jgi:hypothetical protein